MADKEIDQLSPAEREILVDLLVDPGNTPNNISENIDKTRTHVSMSLKTLEELGLVRNKGSGVYALTLTGTSAAAAIYQK